MNVSDAWATLTAISTSPCLLVWPHRTHHCHFPHLKGGGLSFTRSFLRSWGYHLNCWSGRQPGFLVVEMEVRCGLQLRSQVSGLLSLIEVYFSFFLDIKFNKVVISRSLICSLAIDHMGHPPWRAT